MYIMSKCSCKKCKTNVCCETICDPCVLLVEPCNPCPSKQVTYCVPNPPCYPYCPPPCGPCPPYPSPCAPTTNWTCPQYVVYTSTLGGSGGTVTLTNTMVNSYNMFVFNNTSVNDLTVVLPLISTLNNYNKKFVTITNMASTTITLTPNSSDSISGLSTVTLEANKSAVLYTLPGISSGLGGSVWSLSN
jgi:hypothetical protein